MPTRYDIFLDEKTGEISIHYYLSEDVKVYLASIHVDKTDLFDDVALLLGQSILLGNTLGNRLA